MRKGKLVKEKNDLKNSIDWERFSQSGEKWITTKAYLNAHDMKTFVGLVEGNGYQYAIKSHFHTIEEAFEWAESQVDYKKGLIAKTEGKE